MTIYIKSDFLCNSFCECQKILQPFSNTTSFPVWCPTMSLLRLLVLVCAGVNEKIRQVSKVIFGHYFDPQRDIVLVTGGSSGLGKEMVRCFAAKGAVVIVYDLKIPDQNDAIPGVHYYAGDVSNRHQIFHLRKQIKQDFGIVTVLINNAAISKGMSLVELSFKDIEKTIQVNLISSFYTIKTFLPDMIKTKRGYIVTIASVLGYMSPARLSVYGASKSGLIALHESLTYELGPPSLNPYGIKTLLVCPGQLQTGMFDYITTPSSLFAPELDPKYVAKSVLRAIELGKRGEIKLPAYSKILPVFRALPWPVTELARNISGIDRSINTIKSAISLLTSPSTTSTSPVSNTGNSANVQGVN